MKSSSTIGEPSSALKPAQAAPSTGRITSLALHADENAGECISRALVPI
jgi:hypothetical protein